MLKTKRYHMIIDVTEVKADILQKKEELDGFLKNLPGKIGMSVLVGPLIAEGIPENPGLSGFVIIDFSHISVHTFTKAKEALIDVFSCKPYDKKVVLDSAMLFLNVKENQCRVKEVSWG